MESRQGRLLIAAQSLSDPNFERTVVLIAVHGEDGALGLILNRDMPMPLIEIWEKVSQAPCVRTESVKHGGPVGGTLMAVHERRDLMNLALTDDLFISTELDAMEELAGMESGRVLFYVGHSGWGPGQLESEIEDGAWLDFPATPDDVFGETDPQTLWKKALVQAGRHQVVSLFDLKHVPSEPREN
jgi:putative transcriptional regulator